MFTRLRRHSRRLKQMTSHRCPPRLPISVEWLEPRYLLTMSALSLDDVVDLAPLPGGISKASSIPKLDTALLSTFQEWIAHQQNRAGRDAFSPSHARVQSRHGQVTIDAAAADDTESMLADLQSLGLQNGVDYGSLVSGLLPISALDEAAELDSVRFVSAAFRPMISIGEATSQGDLAMNANEARATFGVDGNGVKVGVLSDSFDTGSVGSYATDIGTGDLPPGVEVLSDYPGGTDEGRGMMQLIHDVAPGANLAFHTAFNGMADFAQGIVDLAASGADVIVDDVFYFEEPMFQDGIIAQAVNTVVADGVSYFSSAGNASRQSYESAYTDSGISITVGSESRGSAHDFDPGPDVDFLQSIYVPLLSSFVMTFQWDEPFFSVSGGAGAGSDLDIYVVNADGTAVVAQSITRNIGGDAVEVLQFTNGGDLFGNFNIMITKFAGADPGPGLMKYLWYDTGFSPTTVNEFGTASSTTFGHANAAGAEAVGAAYYGDTPEFGTDPPLVESFSSAGGTPILFDTAGTRLSTPEIRQKPEIVAPDGTNTTFFPQGNDTDGDGFPNFFGTSAASPHAAAVAALMLETNPDLTPIEVYAALQNTALDMGDLGFDYDTGYGFIQADLALAAVPSVPRLSLSITDTFILENSGATVASVTRFGTSDLSTALVVSLTNSDPNDADVPTTVTIPVNETSTTFPITAIDDDVSDGDQVVNVTAMAAGFVSGGASLTILDDEPKLLSQWASEIVDFSSEWNDPFNPGAWQAIQALGPPDTFAYGDLPTAWEAATADGNGVEWLTLGYSTPVLATGATIRETYGNGFVTSIDVREAGTANYHTVWTGTDGSQPGTPVNFGVSWPITGFFIDALRVTINSFHVIGDWEAIDAVELLGWTAPPPPPPATLGDRVWADLNKNGTQDSGEFGVAGVVVNLLNETGVSTGLTTTTDSNGNYSFTNLAEGNYIVEFVLPADYDRFSSQNAGSNNTQDSDVDPVTGRTSIINLAEGQNDTSWDAGLISDIVFVTDDRSVSETTTSGTVASGSYLDTYASDNVYEEITERHSGGKPQTRISYLEHEWIFDVTGGENVAFFVQASRTNSGDGDDFQFVYSTDGSNYVNMLSVTNSVDDDEYVSFTLPPAILGTIFVRVTDADRTPGNNTLDTLFVDDMFIRSTGASSGTSQVVTIVATDADAAESGLDPGVFAVSRNSTNGDLTVFFSVSGSATPDADFALDPVTSVTIVDGQSSATITVAPLDDATAEGNETVVLDILPDAAYLIGSSASATVTIADDDDDGGGSATRIYANSEVTEAGNQSGGLANTLVSDDSYEVLTEQHSGGKPSGRISFLQHLWTFTDVPSTGNRVFSVEAHHTANSEGDDFQFSYSTDGISFDDMMQVNKLSDDDQVQSFLLPDGVGGTVYVRVLDTDRSVGNRDTDSLFIDELFILVEGASAARASEVSPELLLGTSLELEHKPTAISQTSYAESRVLESHFSVIIIDSAVPVMIDAEKRLPKFEANAHHVLQPAAVDFALGEARLDLDGILDELLV